MIFTFVGDEQILFLLEFNQQILFGDQQILFGDQQIRQHLHSFLVISFLCSLKISFV